jgi:3-oxoacyl-[acyl-carrier-protein] synthase-3
MNPERDRKSAEKKSLPAGGGVRILTLGKALPSATMRNEDFEKTLDTSDEWIRTRTGILERRFCRRLNGENASSLAVHAAALALEKAERTYHIQKEEIGLVITATCSSRYEMPSTACIVQEELGLKGGIPAFDLNAACSGFIYGLGTADAMMARMGISYGLVIGTEEMSRLLDMGDRSTCVLFGDGAAAAVVAFDRQADFAADLGAAGDKEALYSLSSVLRMDGRRVFRFACLKLEEEIRKLEELSGIRAEDVDYIVCHQANYRIIRYVQSRLGLPEEKFPMNLSSYGNTSAASIPLMLCDLQDEGKLTAGTRVFCVGFGAGLTWGAASLKFGGMIDETAK